MIGRDATADTEEEEAACLLMTVWLEWTLGDGHNKRLFGGKALLASRHNFILFYVLIPVFIFSFLLFE